MTAEIKNGKLILTLDIKPAPSISGKSTVIASTHGNQPLPVQYEGQTVICGVNAYVKR